MGEGGRGGICCSHCIHWLISRGLSCGWTWSSRLSLLLSLCTTVSHEKIILKFQLIYADVRTYAHSHTHTYTIFHLVYSFIRDPVRGARPPSTHHNTILPMGLTPQFSPHDSCTPFSLPNGKPGHPRRHNYIITTSPSWHVAGGQRSLPAHLHVVVISHKYIARARDVPCKHCYYKSPIFFL